MPVCYELHDHSSDAALEIEPCVRPRKPNSAKKTRARAANKRARAARRR